ncbi:hypothetical protein GJ496_003199 [Pomphorhynchus laevis]|nr:hypothetical protein GJ496_003199 [Pomphorhynchus laevis]
MCQTLLAGYLESKRLIFPRFYFLSDPVLLQILGKASEPIKLQPYFNAFTESVNLVKFNESGKETEDYAGKSSGQSQQHSSILAMQSEDNDVLKLVRPVYTKKTKVEEWLGDFLLSCQDTVIARIPKCVASMGNSEFDLQSFFLEENQQFELIILQLLWTATSENAIKNQLKTCNSLRKASKYFQLLLDQLIERTVDDLSSMNRLKYDTYITIHIHQRDVYSDLANIYLKHVRDFDCTKQRRFYYEDVTNSMVVSITEVDFMYRNEFPGCSERLVITPLTDRCYISLAKALGMCYGGKPAGQTGTGKTETTKDMVKSIGNYCNVLNCSKQFDYKRLGKTFKGLTQTGCWRCFDEFNRINLPVLSVAAQHIQTLLHAKRNRHSELIFTDGQRISTDTSFAIIITMNPGYADRTELSNNLKVNFRVVAMMVPDRQIIIRVKLDSCGFKNNVILPQKFYLRYKLCEDHLSKQVHCDFNMRNVCAVLRTPGTAKKQNAEEESVAVLRALRDTNLSKLVDEDERLFLSLLNDLFRLASIKADNKDDLHIAIDFKCNELNLCNRAYWNLKILQLYNTQLVRHSIMVIGPSSVSKSSCITVLQGALTIMGTLTREYGMNSKAITSAQMFIELDVATNNWTDGIFSILWRRFLKMYSNSVRQQRKESWWMVLDGPVYAVWIGNLNSVLDDNKLLTLANADRIPMATNVKVIFEVHNIDNASLATASRSGMVYMSGITLSWGAFAQSWLASDKDKKYNNAVYKVFDNVFHKLEQYVRINLSTTMSAYECNYISRMLSLTDGINAEFDQYNGNKNVLKRLSYFTIIWSFGALLKVDDRSKLKIFIRDNLSDQLNLNDQRFPNTTVGIQFPNTTVSREVTWEHWSRLVNDWTYPIESESPVEYSKILVPKVDNVRTIYLVDFIAKQKKPDLLVGEQSTVKSVIINNYMSISYDATVHECRTMNFSSATTPNQIRLTLESYFDKRVANALDCKLTPANEKSTDVYRITRIWNYYKGRMTEGLIYKTINSLDKLREHLLSRKRVHLNKVEKCKTALYVQSSDALNDEHVQTPVFCVDVILEDQMIKLSPSLDKLQHSVNQVVQYILNVSKGVKICGQSKKLEADTIHCIDYPGRLDAMRGDIDVFQLILKKLSTLDCKYTAENSKSTDVYNLFELPRAVLYNDIRTDVKVNRIYKDLSNCIVMNKEIFESSLQYLYKYSYIWQSDETISDKSVAIRREDFGIMSILNGLSELDSIVKYVQQIEDYHNIFQLKLIMTSFKSSIVQQVVNRKLKACEHVQQLLIENVSSIHVFMQRLIKKLDKELHSVDDFKTVLSAIDATRSSQHKIERSCMKLRTAFNAIAYHYQEEQQSLRPFNITDKSEELAHSYEELIAKAELAHYDILKSRSMFVNDLLNDIEVFFGEHNKFDNQYQTTGPMIEGVAAKETSDRMRLSSSKFDLLRHRHRSLYEGEQLFNLPHRNMNNIVTFTTLLHAKRNRHSELIFTDGQRISTDTSFAIIITMNPGYADKTELSNNLKVNFIVLAMMVPDRQIIIRFKLDSCGFKNNVILPQKIYLLYKLCEDQLSKQVDCDFGMRNVCAVLRTPGIAKKPNAKEESVAVLRVLRDTNLSKLVDEDERLFLSLLNDLFPSVSIKADNKDDLHVAIDFKCNELNLCNHADWNLKILQLYNTQLVRHGIMVLGPSVVGKSFCITVLEGALTSMGTLTREYRMNPKAITSAQMFGELDVATNDWTDRIFSILWRRFLKMYSNSVRQQRKESWWMVLDGPVYAVWIGNLNSVLDDNKLLTLANADRIPMATNVKVIFEVHNIDNASVNLSGCLTAMRQEITRSHHDWAPDFFTVKSTETRMNKEDVRQARTEGVYIYGMYFEGAAWNPKQASLCEPANKILYHLMPVIHMYAVNEQSKTKKQAASITPIKSERRANQMISGVDKKQINSKTVAKIYDCPVYKRTKRTDENYITSI